MLPLIDVSREDGAIALAECLTETGFSVLTGHGLSVNEITDLYDTWNQFFILGDKSDFPVDPETQAGYFSTANAETAKNAEFPDLKEYFQYWPGNPLPASVRPQTGAIYTRLFQLASTVLQHLQANTPQDFWRKLDRPLCKCLSSNDTMLRVIRYPAMTGNEAPAAIRAAAHEDINFVTLLPAADEPGLEIETQRGWQSIEAPPGSIIVNVGDMMQELTDGRLPSTTHRVVNPESNSITKSRMTAPLFCHPEPSLVLSDRYTAGSYLKERLNEINPEKLRPS